MTDEPVPDSVGNDAGKTRNYEVGKGKPPKHTQFGQPGATTKRGSKPKDFTKLRELAVQLGNEAATATKDGKTAPVIIDGHAVTQIEMLLRQMIHDNPARFVEIAFGKVPDRIESLNLDVSNLDDEQLERVARGDDLRSIIATSGASRDRKTKAAQDGTDSAQ